MTNISQDSLRRINITGTTVQPQLTVVGDFTATGVKSALVQTASYGKRMLNAVESPENWFEDFGSAQLKDGATVVRIDDMFAETVNTDMRYHVFLTSNGNCLLSVSDKTPASFKVKQLFGKDQNCEFDYRIVAKRKGYEKVRLTRADEANQKEQVAEVTK